jgi:DNA-binding beta-propeller fold protein YncE
VSSVPVGHGPVALAAVGRNLWVANRTDDTLTRVDTRTQETRTFGGFPYPISLAAEGPRVWVGSESSNEVVAIDGAIGTVVERLQLNPAPAGFVAFGEGSLWVSHGTFYPGLRYETDWAFSRIDVLARKVTTTRPPGALGGWIAVGLGAAWSSLTGAGELLRIDARDGRRQRISVGSAPLGVSIGYGAVWVASGADDEVRRINAATGNVEDIVEVGNQPLAVAAGAGSIWVANNRDRTVSRVDPRAGRVLATISVSYFPTAIHVADGAVWVAVMGDPVFSGSDVMG